MQILSTDIIKELHSMIMAEESNEEQTSQGVIFFEGNIDYIIYRSNLITDPIERSAHVLHGIATSHPFLDGNKRTAWVASLTILQMEGLYIEESDDNINTFVRGVAAGKIKKRSIEQWFNERKRLLAK